MKIFRVAVAVALLTSPAYGQLPPINLMQDGPSKSPEQRAAETAQEKAYKDSLRKIPDGKASTDPWGNVRSGDSAKTASKAPVSRDISRPAGSRTAASAKSRVKAGNAAD